MGGNEGFVTSKAFNDVYSTVDGIMWEKIDTKGAIFSPRSLFGTSVFKDKL